MRHTPAHQILDCYLVQITKNLTSDFFPERFCRIIRTSPGREHAIVVLITSHRVFNRRHDIGNFDLRRFDRKKISATRSPDTLHEARLSELSEHLLKV